MAEVTPGNLLSEDDLRRMEPEDAVRALQQQEGLSEHEARAMLQFLLEGGDTLALEESASSDD